MGACLEARAHLASADAHRHASSLNLHYPRARRRTPQRPGSAQRSSLGRRRRTPRATSAGLAAPLPGTVLPPRLCQISGACVEKRKRKGKVNNGGQRAPPSRKRWCRPKGREVQGVWKLFQNRYMGGQMWVDEKNIMLSNCDLVVPPFQSFYSLTGRSGVRVGWT